MAAERASWLVARKKKKNAKAIPTQHRKLNEN
jgi:hypothetical protein